MNRRDFFTVAKKKTSLQNEVKQVSRGLASGLSPYTGPWTMNEVTHLLRRTMFGAKKTDIDYFLGLSMNEAVDQLVATTAAPAPPLRDYGLIEIEEGTFDDLGVLRGQTWINDFNTSSPFVVRSGIGSLRIESLRKWWIGLMLHQERTIEEKMVLFWHNHFSVQIEEVQHYGYLYTHHNLLRKNALGNIRELTKKVTIDPAMLMHLNGQLNDKKAPDENYARELQELMTVGKGNDSLYTESDVREAARVLTGWRINDVTWKSFLDTGSHDMGTKKFSSFYNNTTINGSSSGAQEVNQLVDMIFTNKETARFICRKLYTWFVYYNIDEATEASVIHPLADIMISNNYDVKPVLLALFKSEHFFDINNQACQIKSPCDLIIGSLREFNVSFPPMTDYLAGYKLFLSVYNVMANLQQDLFQPPDVSGWPAYHQDPMFYEVWVNSNTLPKRTFYLTNFIEENIIDTRSFAANITDPGDPDKLIEGAITLLYRYPLSLNSRNYLKNKLLLNDTGDNSVWTTAWNSNNNAVINPALKELFKYIMSLPEYHLC